MIVVADHVDDVLAIAQTYIGHLGIESYFKTVACKRVRQQLRGVAFFHRQEQRLVLGNDGSRPETGKRLGKLAAQRSAANHQQSGWEFGEVEDVLVGQQFDLAQAGNVRCVRT